MGIPIKTLISRTKKITLFASVFCGTLLLADVNFVLARKLRLHSLVAPMSFSALLHLAKSRWWWDGRFVDFIMLSPLIIELDGWGCVWDKKNIPIYWRVTQAQAEKLKQRRRQQWRRRSTYCRLSWVLMYDLKLRQGRRGGLFARQSRFCQEFVLRQGLVAWKFFYQ